MNYDRVILELISRVSALEEEVAQLKSVHNVINNSDNNEINSKEEYASITQYLEPNNQSANSRDTTKYILDGKRYGKNRLVLAIVHKYVSMNTGITPAKLMMTFDKSLQGSLGVVRILSDVMSNYSDYERRFFCQPDEVIHTASEDCVVCTQWGKFNIDNMITRAKELGIDVTII